MIPAIAPVENSLPETFGITDGLMISVTVVVIASLDRLALVVTLNDVDVDGVIDELINGEVVDGILNEISKSSSSVENKHENFHTTQINM